MIYVDEPQEYDTMLRYKVWSHMWSDTCDQELHDMALAIGLRREWFQQKAGPTATDTWKRWRNHYDVTPAKRALAIKLGAKAVTAGEIRDIIKRVFEGLPNG